MFLYCKEISYHLIKEFCRFKTIPSSQPQYRAARCMCLFLNAFYKYPKYLGQTFKSWKAISQFIEDKRSSIMSDLGNIRGKCEIQNISSLVDNLTIRLINEEFFSEYSECNSGSYVNEINSPKIQNLLYKPIFCYTYFTLNYLNLKQRLDNFK